MRSWIAVAGKLYPRAWRERYGDEFDALLQDAAADWRQLADVFYRGVMLQLSDATASWKLAAYLAFAGTTLALAGSYRVPSYVSSATFQIVPVVQGDRHVSPNVIRRETEARVQKFANAIRGRVLVLDVDRMPLSARKHHPMGIEPLKWRDRDLEIRVVDLPDQGAAVTFSYAGPDREKTRAAVEKIILAVNDANSELEYSEPYIWEAQWSEPMPFGEKFEVIRPASEPGFFSPIRTAYLAWGAAAGILLGLVTAAFRRYPAVSLRLAFGGLAGCALTAGLSLLVTEQYTGRLLLTLSAPFDPEHASGAAGLSSLNYWEQRLRKEVLHTGQYAAWYGDTARTMPLKAGGQIGMHMVDATPECPGHCLEVNVTSPDKEKADRGVRETDMALRAQYEADRHMETLGGPQLKKARMLDIGEQFEFAGGDWLPPMSTHYRLELTLAGGLLGLLLSIVLRRRNSTETALTPCPSEA